MHLRCKQQCFLRFLREVFEVWCIKSKMWVVVLTLNYFSLS